MTRHAVQGRLAGLTYLGVVAAGIFALAYVPSRLSAPDAAGTLANVSDNAALFRASIAAGTAMNILFLVLPVVLFQLFERHGRLLAVLMVLLAATSVPIWMIALDHKLAIVSLVFDGAPTAEPLAAAVRAHLDAFDRVQSLASVFWGLWLAPLGVLILKSRAIPGVLGVLLILGCVGYLAEFFGPLLSTNFDGLPLRHHIRTPGSLGEIGTCLWLLIMGVRKTDAPRTDRRSAQQ